MLFRASVTFFFLLQTEIWYFQLPGSPFKAGRTSRGGITSHMGGRSKKLAILGSVLLLVFIVGVGYVFISRNDAVQPGPVETDRQIKKELAGPSSGTQPSTIKEQLEKTGMSVEDQLVRELRKYYGETIEQKSTQASIYEVRKSIAGTNPDGMQFFYSVLRRAFPDFAAEIMDTLDKLDDYNQWLEENDDRLSQMSDDARLAALWEKRISLFGDDAYEIWDEELLAADARKSKVKDAIDRIDRSTDMSIAGKLDIYQNTLREAYEGSPEEFILSQTPILSKAFFSIDSVQDELKQMSPDERQQMINTVRRDMGFSEQQVAYMEKVDARRNKRWENGLEYMEERDKVVAGYDGEEQKEKLTTLREKYFKHEAKTIELEEEKDKFFRFKRPRYYGRN